NPIAWAVLLLSMRLRRGELARRQAFVAGLVLYLPMFWWIRPLVWPLWPVVAAWCAMYEGFFGWLAGKLFRRQPVAGGWVVMLPAAHLLFDMLRTTVLTGFPWALAGYSGWKNPILLGSADLLGVHAATCAILVLGAGLA